MLIPTGHRQDKEYLVPERALAGQVATASGRRDLAVYHTRVRNHCVYAMIRYVARIASTARLESGAGAFQLTQKLANSDWFTQRHRLRLPKSAGSRRTTTKTRGREIKILMADPHAAGRLLRIKPIQFFEAAVQGGPAGDKPGGYQDAHPHPGTPSVEQVPIFDLVGASYASEWGRRICRLVHRLPAYFNLADTEIEKTLKPTYAGTLTNLKNRVLTGVSEIQTEQLVEEAFEEYRDQHGDAVAFAISNKRSKEQEAIRRGDSEAANNRSLEVEILRGAQVVARDDLPVDKKRLTRDFEEAEFS